jgi:hypothetical protein
VVESVVVFWEGNETAVEKRLLTLTALDRSELRRFSPLATHIQQSK